MSEYNNFRKAWAESPAAKLLVPDPNINLALGKENGYLASICFLAFERGQLPRIDELITKFDIPTKGTNIFKGQLKENWLDRHPGRRRNVSNATMAALAELVVADKLFELGYEIVDLSAWNEVSSDIVVKRNNRSYYIEVKYFSDSPKEYQSRVNAAKGDNSGFWGGTINGTLNYFFHRLAEAAIQLDKYPEDERVLCFVFDHIAEDGEEIFSEYFRSFTQWYADPNGEYEGFPQALDAKDAKKKAQIISRSPAEWLKGLALWIGIMKTWHFEFSKSP